MKPDQYKLLLIFYHAILFIDMFANSFCATFYEYPVFTMLLFIVQDVCIVFALISILLMFSSTYLCQGGFFGSTFSRFHFSSITASVYLCLSISLHCWTLVIFPANIRMHCFHIFITVSHIMRATQSGLNIVRKIFKALIIKREMWEASLKYYWTPPMVALHVFQRLVSVVHYYTSKRTLITLSNPEYQADWNWIQNKVPPSIVQNDVTSQRLQ